MKTTSTLLTITLLSTTFLTAGPIAKAVVLDNNGNPTNSIAKKAVKVNIADNVIDPSDTAAQKAVKASIVKGDQRTKRQLTR